MNKPKTGIARAYLAVYELRHEIKNDAYGMAMIAAIHKALKAINKEAITADEKAEVDRIIEGGKLDKAVKSIKDIIDHHDMRRSTVEKLVIRIKNMYP